METGGNIRQRRIEDTSATQYGGLQARLVGDTLRWRYVSLKINQINARDALNAFDESDFQKRSCPCLRQTGDLSGCSMN